jgi:hypothetical protein
MGVRSGPFALNFDCVLACRKYRPGTLKPEGAIEGVFCTAYGQLACVELVVCQRQECAGRVIIISPNVTLTFDAAFMMNHQSFVFLFKILK